MSPEVLRVSDDGLSRTYDEAPGAVVRKPSEKEPAGSGRRRCRAGYGDFGAMRSDVAAADVAGGVIVRRRCALDAAGDARQRALDADLSFAGLAG
jgi:hypothetical protein